MIEVGLDFEGAGAIARVVRAFTDLTAPLRPVYFSHDEKPASVADRIDDQTRFSAFVTKSESGFFLHGPGVTYSVRNAAGKPLICDCFLDLAAETAEQFLAYMATAKPVFGFACAPGEREQRNRVTATLGVNTIESWVGRDTSKYVPGFYWLTLLPDTLAKQHGIPLRAVEAVAHEHINLDGGQHLYRFYERPEGWQETPAVAELCATLSGVFDVEKVKPQLLAAKSFSDLNALLRQWR